jgi:hypothetical protein
MCMVSLLSYGNQAVSLCSSHSVALTAHSYVCAWHVALFLPSHGEQPVSLCSSRSGAVTTHSLYVCMACGAVSAIAWWPVRKCLLFSQRSFHSSLVSMCMHAALSLPLHGGQFVSVCSFHSAAFTAHSCLCACMRRCLCHCMVASS